MKPEKYITPAGLGLLLYLAIGAAVAEVVVVVPAQSPVKTLTRSELSDIFLGKMSRLPGGERVVPIDLAEGLPTRREFYNQFLDRSPAQIKSHWSKLIFTGRGRPPPVHRQRQICGGIPVRPSRRHRLSGTGTRQRPLTDSTD